MSNCVAVVRGSAYTVDERERVVIALDGHGPRIPGTLGNRPQTGGTRADGSRITAGVPSAIPLEGEELPDPGAAEPSLAEPTAVGPD